jgi:hypothetical protein
MKKEITLGQLMSVGVTLLIAIVTAWITLSNKVSQQDVEIRELRERQNKTDQSLVRIESKLELILIKLENKKDREQ